MKAELESTIKAEEYIDCLEMSEKLLDKISGRENPGCRPKYAFKEKFDESMYAEISGSSYVDRKGKTRLFIAMGKVDGMTPDKLREFIQEETGDSELKIKDAEIFPNFSFVTVPFAQAETLLDIFKNKKRGRKNPLWNLPRNQREKSSKNMNNSGNMNNSNDTRNTKNTKKRIIRINSIYLFSISETSNLLEFWQTGNMNLSGNYY